VLESAWQAHDGARRLGAWQRRLWHIDAGTAVRGARRAGALQAARMPRQVEPSTSVLGWSIAE
jgi:hypothetical protein